MAIGSGVPVQKVDYHGIDSSFGWLLGAMRGYVCLE